MPNLLIDMVSTPAPMPTSHGNTKGLKFFIFILRYVLYYDIIILIDFVLHFDYLGKINFNLKIVWYIVNIVNFIDH